MQDETWENGDWRLGNVMKSNNCVVCWETKNGLTRLLGEHFSLAMCPNLLHL
jgi:hypothetical protein